MTNKRSHYWLLPAVLLMAMTSSVSADYSMSIQLSNDRVVEGGNVTATCDVSSQQPINPTMTVVWVKRTVENEEVEIGSDTNMTDRFHRTRRYSARRQPQADPKQVRFTLTIVDLKSGDSGEIGCNIRSHRIHIFKPFTVLAPVKTIRLRSHAMDKSRAESYVDRQNVSFTDGAIRQFSCDVSGSFPKPDVSIWIGDRELTSEFNRTEKLVMEGPASLKGVQTMHYDVELIHPNLHIGFEYGGKSLRCVSTVPHSSFGPANASIYVTFLSYRPKFVDCSNPVVLATPYQKNIRFECDIQAVPAVSDVRVKYGKRSLRAGSRDGHYHTTLIDQPIKSETMRRLVFSIDKVYPQHFRNYTIVATNEEGSTELNVQIARDPKAAALSQASSRLLNIPTVAVVIITALLLHS